MNKISHCLELEHLLCSSVFRRLVSLDIVVIHFILSFQSLIFAAMKGNLFAVFAALHSLTLAAPTANTRHIKHEKRDESSRWIKRDAVASTFTLPMRFGLVQGNLDKGHDMLMEV